MHALDSSTTTPARSAALFRRNRNFLWYLSASFVSGIGSAVTVIALPLFAVVTLHASPAATAMLAAVGIVPSLLLQVPAGVGADRLGTVSRLRFLILSRLIAGVFVLLLPILWAVGVLTIPVLLIVRGAQSLVGIVAAACGTPVLVEMLDERDLVEASGQLQGTSSATEVLGQALAGGLIALFAAPLALVADAISFGASALLTSRVSLPNAKTTGGLEGRPTTRP
jgi:Na+/melibiose symporter-like transporter